MNSTWQEEDRLRQLGAVDAGLRHVDFLHSHLQRLRLLSRESGREALAGALLQRPAARQPAHQQGDEQGRPPGGELDVFIGRAKLQHAQEASSSIQQLQAKAEHLYLERSRLEQRLHALVAPADDGDERGASFQEALQADEHFDSLDSGLVLAELRSGLLQQPQPAAERQQRTGGLGRGGPGPGLHSAKATNAKTMEILEHVLPQLRRQRRQEGAGAGGGPAAAAEQPGPVRVLPEVLLDRERGSDAIARQLRGKLEVAAQALQGSVAEQEQVLRRHQKHSHLLQLQLRALSGGRYDGVEEEGGAEAEAAGARGALRAALRQRPVAVAVAQAAVQHLVDRALLLVNMRPSMEQAGAGAAPLPLGGACCCSLAAVRGPAAPAGTAELGAAAAAAAELGALALPQPQRP
jgi:hypothetical protein